MLVEDPVKRVDNMTMAHGLEARTPFLDHELVELAAACPPELKLADGGKGVLKDAARGVVPDAVIDRPKGYFPVPALTHLEGPVLALVEEALRSSDRGLFKREAVDAMLAEPERGPHEPRRLLAVAARPAGALAPAPRGCVDGARLLAFGCATFGQGRSCPPTGTPGRSPVPRATGPPSRCVRRRGRSRWPRGRTGLQRAR